MRKTRTKSRANAQFEIASQGEIWVEAIGEMFMRERFTTNCDQAEDSLFSAAQVERFTRSEFPRVLVNLNRLDRKALTKATALADLKYVSRVLTANWAGFEKLLDATDDPELFVQRAVALGLTEGHAQDADGGLLALVIVLVVCLSLTGCPSPKPATPAPTKCGVKGPNGLLCIRSAGHNGSHIDFKSARWR